MRYLISRSKEDTKRHRQKYLYEVFNLYTIEKTYKGNFIILDSIPIGAQDMIFIIGHDIEVYEYIKENFDTIDETNIIAITCNSDLLKEFVNKGKNIFVPKVKEQLVSTYKGDEYGFEFDVTDCEIDIFNYRKLGGISIIDKCMIKL